MTARTVYFKSPSVKELLSAQNGFFTKYGVRAGTPGAIQLFKVDMWFNQKTDYYESFLTFDMPVGGVGSSRLDQVDNTRFNVMTEDEEREIARQQQQQEATPMPA